MACRRPAGRAASTKVIAVAWVAAARSLGMMPIASATGQAGPRTSTGLPLERRPCARSTTVGRNPWRASQ